MDIPIYTKDNKQAGKLALPKQFIEPLRRDLIQKAVLTIQANRRQPYGAHPEAGKRSSVRLSKKRRDYRGSYGHGISRIPRKIMTRRGTQFNWTGAFAPGTVGGRRAHPPKSEKDWTKQMNTKEMLKATRSALGATLDKDLVLARDHKIPSTYPFILDTSFEQTAKTKDVKAILTALGFAEELKRGAIRTVRAGKGTMRGRTHKKRKSLLLVMADDCPAIKAAQNIPGIDVVPVYRLNTELLAPGSHPGRATLFTKAALERMDKEKLFIQKVAK